MSMGREKVVCTARQRPGPLGFGPFKRGSSGTKLFNEFSFGSGKNGYPENRERRKGRDKDYTQLEWDRGHYGQLGGDMG